MNIIKIIRTGTSLKTFDLLDLSMLLTATYSIVFFFLP